VKEKYFHLPVRPEKKNILVYRQQYYCFAKTYNVAVGILVLVLVFVFVFVLVNG